MVKMKVGHVPKTAKNACTRSVWYQQLILAVTAKQRYTPLKDEAAELTDIKNSQPL